MSTAIDTTPASLQQYALAAREPESKKNELGQDEFLKLMLTQIKHQDPMKPMENGDFIGQMAQFSTVSGIGEMQAAIEGLSAAYGSSQTLQASQLVGREVMIEGSTLVLDAADDANGASGRFTLDAAAGDVTLDVSDPGGALVRRVSLGQHGAGDHDFRWDGLDENGASLPPGRYTATLTVSNGDEDPLALPVLVARTVDSVEFVPGGQAQVNTTAGDALALGDVRQISERASDTRPD